MISQDSKINLLQAQMMDALSRNDVGAYTRACETSAQIARSYLVQTEEEAVALTQKVPVVPFPEWMGLKGAGFSLTEPFLVAAFPGNGKTFFCANLAAYLLTIRQRVTIYCNEGRAEDYVIAVYRVLQTLMEFPNMRRITSEEAYQEKTTVTEWLKTSKLKVVSVKKDGPRELLSRMTQTMSKAKTDVILFDWLQNVNVLDDNIKFKAWAYLAREFESLSMQWKIPIGVFGQINRDGGRERNAAGAPGLGVLEGCPTMEQKSGLVINMKNGRTGASEDFKTDFFFLNIAKNRHGPTGQRTAKADFRGGSFIGPMEADEMEGYFSSLKAQRKRTA